MGYRCYWVNSHGVLVSERVDDLASRVLLVRECEERSRGGSEDGEV